MNSPNPSRGSILLGIAIAVGLHLALTGVSVAGMTAIGAASSFVLGPVLAIGLVQWVYVVPAAIILYRRGSTQTMKGLLIAAGITVMINLACTGVVFGMLGSSLH